MGLSTGAAVIAFFRSSRHPMTSTNETYNQGGAAMVVMTSVIWGVVGMLVMRIIAAQ